MAKKRIIGIEPVSYVSKKTNQPVTGVRIYIATDLVAPSVGVSVKDEFISGASMNDFYVGEVQAVLYEPGYGNQYRCTGVLYLDKDKK